MNIQHTDFRIAVYSLFYGPKANSEVAYVISCPFRVKVVLKTENVRLDI